MKHKLIEGLPSIGALNFDLSISAFSISASGFLAYTISLNLSFGSLFIISKND